MGDNDELMQKFRAAAMKFIEVVDTAPHVDANAFLANVSRSMAELYSIALSLPAVEPDTTSRVTSRASCGSDQLLPIRLGISWPRNGRRVLNNNG